MAVVPAVAGLQCYHCSSQSDPDCGDPFIVAAAVLPSCSHSEPRSGPNGKGEDGGHSVARFLEDCPPDDEDGRNYFCLKTRQEEMGAVLVTRGCGWEEADRQDNCSREEWADRDYVTTVCSCTTAACNSAIYQLGTSTTAVFLTAIIWTVAVG